MGLAQPRKSQTLNHKNNNISGLRITFDYTMDDKIMTNKKNLEHVNVQQAGKNELRETLKQNSLNIVLKAVYYAKKKGQKTITQEELKKALKNGDKT